MKEVGEIQIQHRLRGGGFGYRNSMEWDEYMFECRTDEGQVQQEELILAPSSCGFCLVDMTVVPDKGSRRSTGPGFLWKGKVLGTNYEKLHTVSEYLIGKGWRLAKETEANT
jgi:hypothetical protein